MVRNRKLPDIVQERPGSQCVNFRFRKAHDLADTNSVYLCPPNVSEADLVASVNCGCKCLDRSQVYTTGVRSLPGCLLQFLDVHSIRKVCKDRHRSHNKTEFETKTRKCKAQNDSRDRRHDASDRRLKKQFFEERRT